MALHYYIKPSPFDTHKHIGAIQKNSVCQLSDITQDMLQRGSTITAADIAAVLTVFFDVVSDRVAEGHHVNLPIVNIRPGISGVFENLDDTFDAQRHQFKARLNPGTLMAQKMKHVLTEKVKQPIPQPLLAAYTDTGSQTSNLRLSPGGIGQIVGKQLNFNPDRADEGVYCIAADGTENKVSIIASASKGKIVFAVPENLAAGHYQLEVRKKFGKATSALRKGRLIYALQVV